MATQFNIYDVLGRKKNTFPGMHSARADMLMLTKVHTPGRPLGPYCDKVDEVLRGLLQRKCEHHGFHGSLDQWVLVEIDPEVYPDYPQRLVLLNGLGEPENFEPERVCTVFDRTLELAVEHGARSIALVFVPNPLTQKQLSIEGTAHILRKRVEAKAREWTGGEFPIERIDIFCTWQAKRSVEAGLNPRASHKDVCCPPYHLAFRQ